jgi:ATP-dependent RNA helicase RhlE
MFSATMPPELNRVASEALTNPQRLELAPPSRPAECIEQTFFPVPRHLKADLLDRILTRFERGSVIVFARTKRGADRLAQQLKRRGHDVAVLHGDRSQGQRERAMRDFRRGRVEILVATDIASRGIDVTEVTHVINFDVPLAPEDYVHRVGRTGRMNAAGDALTLVSPQEEPDAAAIERFTGRKVERVLLKGFDYNQRAERSAHGHGDVSSSRGTAHGPRSSRSAGRSADRSGGGVGRTAHRPATANATATRAAVESGSAHGRRPVRNAGDRRSRRKM